MGGRCACSPRCLQRGGLAMGLATNFFGGLVYIYPIYTTALQDALLLSDSQVTVIGTVAHCGLAVISYPASILYRNQCGGRCASQRVDVVTNVITTALQIVASLSLGFLIDYYCLQAGNDVVARRQCGLENPVFGVVLALYLLFGIGVGMGFAHAVWVNGANFHYNLKQKSAAVSAVSFAIGVGSMLLVVSYHYLQQQLGESAIRLLFWFQAAVYLLVGVGRCFFMLRIDTAEIEADASTAASAGDRVSDQQGRHSDSSGPTTPSGGRSGGGGRGQRFLGTFTAAPESLLQTRTWAELNAHGRSSSHGNLMSMQSMHRSKATTVAAAAAGADGGSGGGTGSGDGDGDAGVSKSLSTPFLSAALSKKVSASMPVGLAGSAAATGGGLSFGRFERGAGKGGDDDDQTEARQAAETTDFGNDGSNDSKSPCCQLLSAPLAHVTFWAVFFGIGLGGTYQSMLGFLSPLYADSSADGATKTFASLVTFLSFQVLARLVCVIVYRYCRIQTLLLVVWEVCELAACVLLLVHSTSYPLFILASALFGMGFGGNLSSLAAIVAAHYPGGSLNFPFNFGITMLAPGFGNVIIGVVESVLAPGVCGAALNQSACILDSGPDDLCVWVNATAGAFYPLANSTCVETCELNFRFWETDFSANCYVAVWAAFITFGVLSTLFSVVGAAITRRQMLKAGIKYM